MKYLGSFFLKFFAVGAFLCVVFHDSFPLSFGSILFFQGVGAFAGFVSCRLFDHFYQGWRGDALLKKTLFWWAWIDILFAGFTVLFSRGFHFPTPWLIPGVLSLVIVVLFSGALGFRLSKK